jgi:hypothetical protein
MPQGDVGGKIIQPGGSAGDKADTVGLGNGQDVDFGSPLNCRHSSPPMRLI